MNLGKISLPTSVSSGNLTKEIMNLFFSEHIQTSSMSEFYLLNSVAAL